MALGFIYETTVGEIAKNDRLFPKVVRFTKNPVSNGKRWQFAKLMPSGNIKFVELANYDAKQWWPIGKFKSVPADTKCYIENVYPQDILEEKK
jgi:hypothetical protein